MCDCSEEEYFYKLENMVIRSAQYLCQVFKTRWKVEYGEDWKDDQENIHKLLGTHCGIILKEASPSHSKILLESSTVEVWDTSVMCLVLLNFGHGDAHQIQNMAVGQLKDLENELTYHKSRKITQSEYSEQVTILKESLLLFGMEESEINKLVEESDNTSSSSLETTDCLNLLLENAEQLIKSQDFPGAIQQYSEAIVIPRLSRDKLGDVYEKRATCYLTAKDLSCSRQKNIESAIVDVKKALELNSNSWKAHHVYAQCNKAKNKLSEAIRYYEMALAISPVQKQVREDLDWCKLRINMQNKHAEFRFTASDVLGELAEMKDESRRNLTMKENQKVTGWETHSVFCGDNYYYGLGVPEDYMEAVKFYTLADHEGFALGTYKLGLCYYYGHGVEQDFGKALEIYRRCAAMDSRKRNKFEKFTPLGFNMGVAYSIHAIGQCYHKGLAVQQNLNEAAVWYEKAMEHGHALAATALGIFYWEGAGVTRNEKMAEMCWKQGLQLGNSLAAENLLIYYCNQLEPEMGRIMFGIARGNGHWKYVGMSDQQFDEELTLIQSERCRFEDYVQNFEKLHKVECKGMTFRQRLTRAQQQVDHHCQKLGSVKIQDVGESVMKTIAKKSMLGSKVATDVLNTLNSIFELNKLLLLENDLSKTSQWKAVDLYYRCMMLESHLKCFVKSDPKFGKILTELLYETCDELVEKDMKIRLCYVGYNLWSSLKSPEDYFALGILKEGIRRYPENYGYYRQLVEGLMERKSYESALQNVEEALNKFPEKEELYYLKACIFLESEDVDSSKTIAAFKLFLDNAPRDHRLVPEAYYKISYLYMNDNLRHEEGRMEKLELIKENFNFGKKSEIEQLPCYHPYGISETQTNVVGYLANIDNTVAMVPQLKSVLERKEHLKLPERKDLIIQHRERTRESMETNLKDPPFDAKVVPWKLKQPRGKKMSLLKPITLQEMNPTKDNIFEYKIIDLTIIEEPNLYSNSLQSVAADRNGDTTRVYVDELANVNVLMQRFAVGSRIAVINPYIGQCNVNEEYGIRINELKCVMSLRKTQGMCRFCGEENSIMECSECNRLYCSEECQTLDWKMFKHELICKD